MTSTGLSAQGVYGLAAQLGIFQEEPNDTNRGLRPLYVLGLISFAPSPDLGARTPQPTSYHCLKWPVAFPVAFPAAHCSGASCYMYYLIYFLNFFSCFLVSETRSSSGCASQRGHISGNGCNNARLWAAIAEAQPGTGEGPEAKNSGSFALRHNYGEEPVSVLCCARRTVTYDMQ